MLLSSIVSAPHLLLLVPRWVRRRAVAHVAILAASAIVSTVVSARTVAAQSPAASAPTWELRFTSGALVGTGAQRTQVKDAQMSAAQVSWLVRPMLAVTGTFGWARSRDIATTNDPKLDVFTTDLGVEVRPTMWFADRAATLSPFVGAGAGTRSYNYRSIDADATNNLAGYIAAGAELGRGRLGVRVEVRDYATGFKPLVGTGSSDTRNDVVVMVGMRFNRRNAAQR